MRKTEEAMGKKTKEEFYNKAMSDRGKHEAEDFKIWAEVNGWVLQNGLYYKGLECKHLHEIYPSFLLGRVNNHHDYEMQAMQAYADQEKEAEAVGFAEWKDKNTKESPYVVGKFEYKNGLYTTAQLYAIYLKNKF